MPARNQDGLRCYNSTEAVFDTVDEPDCAPPRRSHGWWYLGAKHEDNFEDVRQRFGTLLGVNFSDTFDPNKTICTPRFGPDDYILDLNYEANGCGPRNYVHTECVEDTGVKPAGLFHDPTDRVLKKLNALLPVEWHAGAKNFSRSLKFLLLKDCPAYIDDLNQLLGFPGEPEATYTTPSDVHPPEDTWHAHGVLDGAVHDAAVPRNMPIFHPAVVGSTDI